MKKNILTIVLLAAIIANIVLTAITLFSIIPSLKRTDEFITKIGAVIDLELESPNANVNEVVPVDQREPIVLSGNPTILLRNDTANSKNSHYAIVTITVTLNKSAADYATIQPIILTSSEIIKNSVIDQVSQYTIEEISLTTTKNYVKEVVLAQIKEYFQTDCIYDITLNYMLN